MADSTHARADETLVLFVDVQTSFIDSMARASEPGLLRLARLAGLARMLGLPVIATRERPIEEKGDVHARLRDAMGDHAMVLEKSAFDALAEPSIAREIAAVGRPHVAVAGSETDVCVLLTVLGLLRAGHRVTLLTDCVFSSDPDPSAALRRMLSAGAVPSTYKTLAYELTATVDRSIWPSAWTDRLASDPSLFPEPEDLPPLS